MSRPHPIQSLLLAFVIALLSLLSSGQPLLAQEGTPATAPTPPPTVAVIVDSVNYDAENDRYLMNLSVVGSMEISELLIIVKELSSGTDLRPVIELPPSGQLVLRQQFSPNDFDPPLRPNQEYQIRILALDREGNRMLRPTRPDDEMDIQDLSIFTVYSFTYRPDEENPMGFAIQAVTAYQDRQELEIKVAPDANTTPDKYAGFIVDEGGQQIATIDPGVWTGPIITVPLPAVMAQPGPQRKYTLNLTIEDTNGNSNQIPFEFAPTPPVRKGLLQRLTSALASNPAIPATLLVIVFAAILTQMIRTRPKPPTRMPRPPVQTMVDLVVPENPQPAAPQPVRAPVGPVRPPTPAAPTRIKVRVLETPGLTGIRDKSVALPFTVGRNDFPDDRQISREHARIDVNQGQLLITDLGSMNGTFLNEQRVEPRQAIPIPRNTQIRLGASTVIELFIEG